MDSQIQIVLDLHDIAEDAIKYRKIQAGFGVLFDCVPDDVTMEDILNKLLVGREEKVYKVQNAMSEVW